MSNEIARRTDSLPAEIQARMKEWCESPRKSYDSLPTTASLEEIINSDSLTISQMSRHIGEHRVLAIISMAIEDVNRMFRRDRRMEESDIVLTARHILGRFWYLKPEDIKKCFMGSRPKQFVLEGDSFLSWLGEYDLRRDNACEDMAVNGNIEDQNPGAITHAAYMGMLEARANGGDGDARRVLDDYRRRARIPTADEIRKKEIEFRIFRHQYLKSKGIIPQSDTTRFGKW